MGREFLFSWLIEEGLRLAELCKMRPLLLAILAIRAEIISLRLSCANLLMNLFFFLQVLLPPLGDVPPIPPGLQKQLDAVASFSTFKKLLEVSSSVVVVRTDVSRCPTYPLQVGLNFDQLVSKGRPSVSHHPKVIF